VKTFEHRLCTFIDTFDFASEEARARQGLVSSAEEQFEAYARQAGAEGFELVSCLKTSSVSGFTAFFKKEIAAAPEKGTLAEYSKRLADKRVNRKTVKIVTPDGRPMTDKEEFKDFKVKVAETELVVGERNPSGEPVLRPRIDPFVEGIDKSEI
jgi:hypothetical protein